MYTHARELYTLCGMTGSYADCSLAHDQAELHLAKSEYPEALRIFVDVLHHMSIPGDPATGISGQLELSIVHARALMGEPRVELQPLLDRAQGLLQKVGYSDNLREGRLVHAHILYADGDARGAYEELIALVRPGKWVGSVELQRHFIEKLSFLSAIGGVREAESWSTVLLLHSLKLKAKPDVHKALKDLGVQFFNNSRDDLGTAQSLLEVALGGLTRMDIHRGRAECLSYLGEIALRRGDKAKAVEHWSLAARLFERCSLKTEVVRVEERLAVVQ
ncbi:hypothetical protein C8F01DRAFT_1173922 [Mycena amicta]|nr:hypothetical protein C8F01DRAFT_1173922 [Mycena amicta]